MVFLLLFAGLLFPCPGRTAIHYTVSLAHPEQHLFHVTMEIPDVQNSVTVQMAAWNALYEIRDFSSHVQQVQAVAFHAPGPDGKLPFEKVPVEKLDKLTWRVSATGKIIVSYDTFWDDSGPFNTQLNVDHAFINPAMILLYVPERRNETCQIDFGSVPAGWAVESATRTFTRSFETGRHADTPTIAVQAPSFDALADGPIEVSHFEEFTLHDLSPAVRVVIHGDNYNRADVEGALRKIVQYETRLMDGAPYDQYTFIFHVGKAAAGGGGGMEHANSTAIYIPSGEYLPNVAAHEFFHLWNVKRIRPASLEPLDYTHEMFTRALWFAEGVTNTYGSYALVRSGLWGKKEFYHDLGAQITELESRPADAWQSAEQSSLDAWLEKYALYNQPQRSVSYYTKGQVLGVLLDIVIRDRTDNQRSLDDVLRAMNQDFGKPGRLYRDSLDVRLTAEKISNSGLADFFDKYVSAAQPLPYAQLFPVVGLALEEREDVRAVLGFTLQREPNGPWSVATVEPGSAAEKSGLRAGDEVSRWNNGGVPRRPERWALQQKPGDSLHLRVRRLEGEQTVDLRLGELREKFYAVVEAPDANARAKRLREGILHGTTDPLTTAR